MGLGTRISLLGHLEGYVYVARYLDGFSVKESVVSLNKEYLSVSRGQDKLQDTVSIQIILITTTDYNSTRTPCLYVPTCIMM